ncbi:MAG: hypothetical protein HW421_771 [Ignavibacteria bacterium]|nr:hypothetical protein [Ignavibacteria bacterium]
MNKTSVYDKVNFYRTEPSNKSSKFLKDHDIRNRQLLIDILGNGNRQHVTKVIRDWVSAAESME